jgi:hypothetical protein
LVILPPEIVLIILGYLQDLDCLFSTVLTCRRLFDIFWNAQQRVIESILSRYIPLETDRAIFGALNALRFVIRQDVIQTNVAQSIFEAAWKLFKAKCREGLLIPFGRALAWSFVLNDRRSDAIEILRLICDGQKPFGWSNQRPLTTQPPRELLDQLPRKIRRRGNVLVPALTRPEAVVSDTFHWLSSRGGRLSGVHLISIWVNPSKPTFGGME